MAIVFFFFFFLSRPDGECIYKRCYNFYKCYYKKPIRVSFPTCFSFEISACCMQQNNKLEFQRNIKLEFYQTHHNFNQSLRNTGKLSIFKEYAIQYSNTMKESLGSIWHKKMQQASHMIMVMSQLQTLRTSLSLTSYGYPRCF